MSQKMYMNTEEFLVKIGKNITKYRKEKGMTSKSLGLECDIEKSNLIAVEKGRINVTVSTLLKIASALNVEAKVFFEFE